MALCCRTYGTVQKGGEADRAERGNSVGGRLLSGFPLISSGPLHTVDTLSSILDGSCWSAVVWTGIVYHVAHMPEYNESCHSRCRSGLAPYGAYLNAQVHGGNVGVSSYFSPLAYWRRANTGTSHRRPEQSSRIVLRDAGSYRSSVESESVFARLADSVVYR